MKIIQKMISGLAVSVAVFSTIEGMDDKDLNIDINLHQDQSNAEYLKENPNQPQQVDVTRNDSATQDTLSSQPQSTPSSTPLILLPFKRAAQYVGLMDYSTINPNQQDEGGSEQKIETKVQDFSEPSTITNQVNFAEDKAEETVNNTRQQDKEEAKDQSTVIQPEFNPISLQSFEQGNGDNLGNLNSLPTQKPERGMITNLVRGIGKAVGLLADSVVMEDQLEKNDTPEALTDHGTNDNTMNKLPDIMGLDKIMNTTNLTEVVENSQAPLVSLTPENEQCIRLKEYVDLLLSKNELTHLDKLHELLKSQEFTEMENNDKSQANEYKNIVDSVTSAKVSLEVQQALAKKLLQKTSTTLMTSKTIFTKSLNSAIKKLIVKEENKYKKEKL